MRAAEAVHARMEVMAQDECVRLLAQGSVGRLVAVSGGEPLVVPVNYVWDGAGVVFRTDPGTLLDTAMSGPVAFEIDAARRRHAGLEHRRAGPLVRAR